MSVQSQAIPKPLGLENIGYIFPQADPHVTFALAMHSQALLRYLAQIHDLTNNEARDAIEVFFDLTSKAMQNVDVA